jgi:2-keto-4-pentenoate hydratase/2-oxohepta-3-ene-1,7-dioic acid hydratase in catechol pathway
MAVDYATEHGTALASLDDGDRITVGVEGVGELTNVCRHR